MASAFQMAEDARQAMGDEATPDSWWFPDGETRDLVGRVFGDFSTLGVKNLHKIKSKQAFRSRGT